MHGRLGHRVACTGADLIPFVDCLQLCGLLTYGVHAQRKIAHLFSSFLYISCTFSFHDLHSASHCFLSLLVTACYCLPVWYRYQHVLTDGICSCSGVQRTERGQGTLLRPHCRTLW